MHSPADAARIIAAANDQAGLEALLGSLGFTAPSLPLDDFSLDRLGLANLVHSARVSSADGSLRALTLTVAPDGNTRDCVTSVAQQLSRRAPHLLWLLVAVKRGSSCLVIAAWQFSGTSLRIGVMLTDRNAVLESDAETLCAMASTTVAQGDVMTYAGWLEILGRDGITRRFFAALSHSIGTLTESLLSSVPRTDAREIALLTASRLVFLSFLETKGWLDGDFAFLTNGFAACMSTGGAYQRRVLEPLFFGTLNTRVTERAHRARAFGRIPFLNGGLFARTAVERIHRNARLPDDALGALFGDVLVRYRFTASENATTWSQTAIDPEILGRVFESLMECDDRKRCGVFYTPHRFVERVSTLALTEALERRGLDLERVEQALSQGCSPTPRDERLLGVLSSIRILDPACGSGAFLIHILERLARLRTGLGDTRAPSEVRRTVLTRSVFGVDSNPTAVWLCELRLWLSVVIESDETDPIRVSPLPNLDRNIRIGDSLAGDAFADDAGHPLVVCSDTSSAITALRDRYVRSTGRRKVSLGLQLDATERARSLAALDAARTSATFERREIIARVRARDLFGSRHASNAAVRAQLRNLRAAARSLARRRTAILRGAEPAFSYPTHFADVADAGGFDVIIGNPPWVRLHNVPHADRQRYRERFSVFRSSAWTDGARAAQASSGFASQTDLAALFLERSLGLLAPAGAVGFLMPSKLWRSLAGGGLRQLILTRTRLTTIEDHTNGPEDFAAVTYPSIIAASLAKNECPAPVTTARIAVKRGDQLHCWNTERRALAFDETPGSPWVLLPPSCRAAFDALGAQGVPLFESVLGRPRLGVKTGRNDAFVVSAGPETDGVTTVTRGSRRGFIETSLLRPLVRGETVTAWRLSPNDERIIWTHAPDGAPLRCLPPRACDWLARRRGALERRTDSRSARWWSLFRLDSAECALPRVVWADFGRTPRAAVIDALDPTVPLNTCYTVTCPTDADALAFAAVLNSRIAAAWLAVIAGIERRRRGTSAVSTFTLRVLATPPLG
ncbi:MAG: hypothetical protein M3R65_05280 [Gemmatimonadota bacterium]|nr:hypothetical protein [Gemmatimonadota bacterium]